VIIYVDKSSANYDMKLDIDATSHIHHLTRTSAMPPLSLDMAVQFTSAKCPCPRLDSLVPFVKFSPLSPRHSGALSYLRSVRYQQSYSYTLTDLLPQTSQTFEIHRSRKAAAVRTCFTNSSGIYGASDFTTPDAEFNIALRDRPWWYRYWHTISNVEP
jgi:hypothetical protein